MAVFFADGRAVSRRLGWAGAFFPFPLAGATSGARCATLGSIRWTASQMPVTAAFRFVNFLIGFKSLKGATPAKLFQTSTRRLAGQEPASLFSSWAEPKYSAVLILAAVASSCEAKTAMLLAESIVKVLMPDIHHSVQSKRQAKCLIRKEAARHSASKRILPAYKSDAARTAKVSTD